MSVRLMSAVFESTTLGPTERLIMLALADHADDDGSCYPSIERLCQRTGLTRRAVQNNIRNLEISGHLAVKRGGGRGGANRFVLSPKGAPETPFLKQRTRNAVSGSEKGAYGSIKGAPDAPEPSRTINNLGGGVDARETTGPEQIEDQPPRVQILAAMGVGPDGIAGPSRFIGGRGDMAEAERWAQLPGMTLNDICGEIRRIMAGKRDGPPSSFRYFTRAMQELSGKLTAPQLEPTQGGRRNDRKPTTAEVDRAILDAAAALPPDYFSNPKYSDF